MSAWLHMLDVICCPQTGNCGHARVNSCGLLGSTLGCSILCMIAHFPLCTVSDNGLGAVIRWWLPLGTISCPEAFSIVHNDLLISLNGTK